MLVWNVFVDSFNEKHIKVHNISDHASFLQDCAKAAKKYKDDREGFEDAIKKELMYYYWSKCEWEIILTSWPVRKNFQDAKVDVYSQVCLNWDVFIDYVGENRKELAKCLKKKST